MVEVSRDGKRIYFTNSLYAAWDEQFYPDGGGSWMVKLDAGPNGGMEFDQNFFLESNDYRVHQVRLEGGDSSSDSYCFPCATSGRGWRSLGWAFFTESILPWDGCSPWRLDCRSKSEQPCSARCRPWCWGTRFPLG